MSTKVKVRTETIDLKEGLENLHILHISDLHLPFSRKRIDRIIEIIESSGAQLTAMTGDYVDLKSSLPKFFDFVKRISLIMPVVFITGNHDKRYRVQIEESLLKIKNCYNLDKTNFNFTSLKGINYVFSSWPRKKNESTTCIDKSHIVLVHNPKHIKTLNLENIDVVLAGHLHGGQFILKKFKNGRLFPGCLFYSFCLERTRVENTHIIVSKGLGDVLPLRINCPYEVVQIEIQ